MGRALRDADLVAGDGRLSTEGQHLAIALRPRAALEIAPPAESPMVAEPVLEGAMTLVL